MEILDNHNITKVSNVRYANFGQRFLASIVDFLVLFIPMAFSLYYGFVEKNFTAALLGSIFGTIYKPLMEGVYGATIGKMVVGIVMVDENLNKTDITQAITKNGVYLINGAIGLLSQYWMFGLEDFIGSEDILQTMEAIQDNPYQTVSSIWSLAILISCFSMLGSERKQTLHDNLAGVFCVEKISLPKDKW